MGHVSREMETVRKNQKEMIEIKNTVTEMKGAFDGFISRFHMLRNELVSFKLGQ